MRDRLSHVSDSGEARMVDVSAKDETQRVARASGTIRMLPETLAAIVNAQVKKGDVLGTARIAAVMAAKRTSELIPLCHPLALTDVQVDLLPDAALPGVRAEVSVTTVGRTGVEMEALTAVSVALLTVYDMAKAMDRAMVISDISLAYKSGGHSGEFSRLDGIRSAPYPESASSE
jgi:cyclic pyranopterin monophosphate synthase